MHVAVFYQLSANPHGNSKHIQSITQQIGTSNTMTCNAGHTSKGLKKQLLGMAGTTPVLLTSTGYTPNYYFNILWQPQHLCNPLITTAVSKLRKLTSCSMDTPATTVSLIKMNRLL